MDFVRTPDDRFENLADYPFAPNYQQVVDGDGGELRIHHVQKDQPVACVEVILNLIRGAY